MKVGMISKRYAKALLEYAVAEKNEDKVYTEMKGLAKSFATIPALRTAMDNPTLTMQDKQDLLIAALGANPSNVSVRFIELVVSNRRQTYLESMALSYGDMYCEEKNISTGKLVTTTPVDKEVVAKMKALVQRVKPGELDFEQEVNPDIEGGFMLFFDTYRYDASVMTQLNRIRQQLTSK